MAAMVPISGSAYTYSYATMGELVAWIIGWDLILEYAIGNVAVAISWANYFRSFMHDAFGIDIPQWLSTDFRTARKIPGLIDSAPHVFGLPIVFNLLALGIVALITIVLVWGIKESAEFNAVMVGVKILVLLFFIGIAFYFVSPSNMAKNWHPFQPTGWGGTLAGAAVVFFAYIGFDAVSTVAEETKNPSRDLPIGIIASLIICTIFYVVVAAVFTGLIPYNELVRRLATEQAEPLTMALDHVAPDARWASAIVSFGSVVAHTAVLLVFQLGQPRIFFSIARDGLLPPVFAKVHPKFKTPHVTTILTGVIVGAFAAVMSIDEMVDLTNIGTLFAFVLVCVGITILRYKDPGRHRPFKVPLGAWLLPMAGAISCLFLMYYLPPTSWWRFVAWLMIGLSVYLSYGYARSELGRKVDRPRTTPGWLMLLALGSLLIAVGILTVPHSSNLNELYAKMASGVGEGKRTIIAVVCIGLGVALGIVGFIIGLSQDKAVKNQSG
jgi:APA family basic amino acid/polyamine antiporter